MQNHWFHRAAIIGGLVLSALSPLQASQIAPESAAQLAAAPRIVVAEVESATSRWNPQGTLIVTDYQFRLVEALRGNFAGRFVLTQGGGSVGEETHQLSDLPVLRTGARYLLILNEADNPVFSSVRYGAAGALEVDTASGRLHGGGDLQHMRELVQRTAVVSDAQLLPARHNQNYPAATYRRDEPHSVQPVRKPLSDSRNVLPPGAKLRDAQMPAQAGMIEPASPYLPRYLVQRAPPPTITFNPLPLAWVYSPSDQNMMSEWNQHGDIFRVLSTPTGTWAWNNNRYDLAGFPSDADMINQFGAGWGATTLAICYSRWIGTGPIVESDIALNPSFSWTLDEAEGTNTTAPAWSFRQTLLHELGHAWGLQHPWETQNVSWPSTMNYGPKWSRSPRLHSDDTAGIRSVYPGITPHDGALSMYRTLDDSGSNQATYIAATPGAESYNHGQSVSFNGAILLENLGTTTLVNPAVDVYLSATRMSYTSAVYLGRSNYTANIGPFPNSIVPLNLGSYLVASTVPTGLYYPVVFLAASGGTDTYPSNNSGWGVAESPVVIFNNTEVLVPTTTVQTTGTGRIGPYGSWSYSVNAVAGATYHFSSCGLGSFDTVIRIYAASTVVSSDNACSNQFDLYWTSPSNQTLSILVSGATGADRGNFQMQYSLETDRIFVNGFQQ